MKSSRRVFLENISKAGALAILPASLPVLSAQALQIAEENAFEVGPYLQNISTSEVTIMWLSTKNSFSWVEHGSGTFLTQKAFNYIGGLIQANNRINKIRLTGLIAGSKHNYRIVSAEILQVNGSQFKFGEPLVSENIAFTTPGVADPNFSMVIINDHHEHAQNIPQLLYKFGYKGNAKDFDLVVFNGDAFNTVNNEKQIVTQLLQPCVEVFARQTPFLFVQGNHEVRGAHSRKIGDYFDFKDNMPYHAFTRGPVRIVVLDAGEDKDDGNWEYNGLAAFDQYRERQAPWLEKEIESREFKEAKFRVLLIHISPWHSGEWHGTLHCRKVFGSLLNKGKIDLQISGHTHRHMAHEPNKDHQFPILIGGGPLEGNRTLIKFYADHQTLKASMIRDDGEIVGNFTIKHKL